MEVSRVMIGYTREWRRICSHWATMLSARWITCKQTLVSCPPSLQSSNIFFSGIKPLLMGPSRSTLTTTSALGYLSLTMANFLMFAIILKIRSMWHATVTVTFPFLGREISRIHLALFCPRWTPEWYFAPSSFLILSIRIHRCQKQRNSRGSSIFPERRQVHLNPLRPFFGLTVVK